MPTFDFTSPNGKQYSVDGPGGATPEQAFQILQQHLGNAPPPGYVLDKKPGLFDDIPSVGGKLGTTFDAEGARRAGYTDAEIRGVQGALQAGYSSQEISDHLSKPRGMFDDIQPTGGKLSNAPPEGFVLDQRPNTGMQGEMIRGIPVIGNLMEKGAAAAGAGIQAITGRDLQGNPAAPTFGERYAKNLQGQEAGHQQYEAENPGRAVAGQLTGGVMATVPLGATALGARALGLTGPLWQRLLTGAAGGAGINALDALTGGQPVLPAAGTGAVLGAALPVVGAVAGGLGRGVRTALQPFTEAGRETRANQIIQRAAEGGPTIATPAQVPGSEPTTAQAMANPGLAGLERTLRNDPTIGPQFAARETANSAVRDAVYGRLSGDQLSLDAAKLARQQAGDAARQAAFAKAGPADAQPVVDLIDKILDSPAGQRDAVQSALGNIRDKLAPKKGGIQSDVEQLYGIRQAAGDMMKFSMSPQKLASTQLKDVQRALDVAIENAAPGYKNYLTQFAAQSKPIDVQTLLQKARVTNPQGDITAGRLDNLIKTIEGMQQFKAGANQAKSMSAADLDQLKALRDDLRMRENSNLGRATGSNTVQNLLGGNALGNALRSNVAGAGIGAVLGYGHDLSQGRFIPSSAATLGVAGGLLGRGLRAKDAAILNKVAAKMLNPQQGVGALNAAQGAGPDFRRLLHGPILAITRKSADESRNGR